MSEKCIVVLMVGKIPGYSMRGSRDVSNNICGLGSKLRLWLQREDAKSQEQENQPFSSLIDMFNELGIQMFLYDIGMVV